MMKFHKYQSNGNDFIIIDNVKDNNVLLNENIKKICNRNLGIGADGLLILKKHQTYDLEIEYYNSDGSKSLCSNGSRCVIDYAYKEKYFPSKGTILAYDGVHEAFIKNDEIFFKLNDVKNIEKHDNDLFMIIGAPHYIKFVNSIEDANIKVIALNIKNSFRIDTNVTFIEKQKKDNRIKATTYEKGVEEETLSCGTGAAAAAIALNYEYNIESPILISMTGGELNVSFEKKNSIYTNIYVHGKADKVFEGFIDIKKL